PAIARKAAVYQTNARQWVVRTNHPLLSTHRVVVARSYTMSIMRRLSLGLLGVFAAAAVAAAPAAAQQPQQQKPNILFIMGDDIGFMQPRIYPRGLMVGDTPNIDRIGNEGAIFMDYVAMRSCTAGRTAFFTGMYPLRAGMVVPEMPGSPSYL